MMDDIKLNRKFSERSKRTCWFRIRSHSVSENTIRHKLSASDLHNNPTAALPPGRRLLSRRS